MATHDQEEVRRFADRVIWFEQGRVVMEGEPDAVLHEYNAPDDVETEQPSESGESEVECVV